MEPVEQPSSPSDPSDAEDEWSTTVDLDVNISDLLHEEIFVRNDQQMTDIGDVAIEIRSEDSAGLFQVRILRLKGETLLEVQTVDVSIRDLKLRLRAETGIEPDRQQLALPQSNTPLQDSAMLSELPAGSDSRQIELQFIAIRDPGNRGPFGLGQDHTWGVWEGMSNSSCVLDAYQGHWNFLAIQANTFKCVWQRGGPTLLHQYQLGERHRRPRPSSSLANLQRPRVTAGR